MDHSHNELSEEEGAKEEMGEDGDERYESLMTAMSKLAPKGRAKSLLRSEPGAVSEFGLASTAGGGGVELKSLLRSLDKTPSKADLNTQLRSLVRKKKTLDVPLYSHEAEKIQRKVAYQKVSDDIAKWDDVVKANRKAEHTSFPLTQSKLGLQTTEEFVQRFKPSTPLEEEIYKVLNGSKYAETKDTELTRAEEEVLSAMSLEEAQLRRMELQKVRALQSYYESKCKRQKRIKSKSYRRIKRKAKAKQEMKRMEEMMKTDPEAAAEELVKQGRIRAEERMTLRHKNTGKWAKGMIRFGKYSEEARNKIADQLDENRALTQKIAEVIQGGDEVGEDGPERDPQPAGAVSLSDINNPWFTGEKPPSEGEGINSPQVENGGLEFVRLQPVVAARRASAPSSLTQDGVKERGDDDVDREIQGELERLQARKMMREGGEEADNGPSTALSGDISEEDSDMGELLPPDVKVGGERRRRKIRAGGKGGNSREMADGVRGETKPEESMDHSLIDEGTSPRKDEEEFEAIQSEATAEKFQLELEGRKKAKKKRKDAGKIGGGAGGKAGGVNPGAVSMLRPRDVMTVTPELVEEGDGIHRSEHLMHIQEAFEDDDVMEDFREEKEAAVEKGKPKPVDLTLPGWGSWGGAGIKVPEKKRKRFTIPAAPAPPRKDDGLHHVIISEDRERKLAQHQVSTLPFPFASVEQFQQSIRAPVGKTWNTPSAVAKMTVPKVTTKRGTIIKPIQEEVLKEEPTGGKQGLPKPDIDLSQPVTKEGKKGRRGRGARSRKRKLQGKN